MWEGLCCSEMTPCRYVRFLNWLEWAQERIFCRSEQNSYFPETAPCPPVRSLIWPERALCIPERTLSVEVSGLALEIPVLLREGPFWSGQALFGGASFLSKRTLCRPIMVLYFSVKAPFCRSEGIPSTRRGQVLFLEVPLIV